MLLVPFLTRPSVVARLAGALSVLDEQGFDAILGNVEAPDQLERHLHALTARHGAEGAVIISLQLGERHLAELRSADVPLVMVDAQAPGVPCTVVDDIRGGTLAAEHLLDLGHRRIAFVGDEPNPDLGFRSTRRRLLGYRRALAARGICQDSALVRLGAHSSTAAAALTRQLLRLPDPPTAIFAASDTQALGVLAGAEQAGLRVPDDLSVIGYDDIESAAQLGLSTVRQPLRASGASGAHRLCAVIRGERVRPMRQELPLGVVARSTTRALTDPVRSLTDPVRAGPARTAPPGD